LSRSEHVRWLAFAVLAAIDAVGLWWSRIALDIAGIERVGAVLALLAALWFAYGRWRPDPRILDLSHSAAQIIALFAVGGLLSYVLTPTALPLTDAALARADHLLGFDWPSWLAWVSGHPSLRRLLHYAYFSATPQIVAITLYLGLSGQPERNAEFVWTLLLSILLVIVVSTLLPAEGALAYFNATQIIWPSHLADFTALRDGRLHDIDLMHLEGLITFPSFHTTLGVLFVYVLRARRLPLLLAGVLNLAMILSVPVEGGHYLVDVIAGTAVALVAIWAADRLRLLMDAAPRRPVPAAADLAIARNETPRVASFKKMMNSASSH
jgi:membrane-associated phospholipid phosphatase